MEVHSILAAICAILKYFYHSRDGIVFSLFCQTKLLEGQRSYLVYLLFLYPTLYLYHCCLVQSLHLVGVPTFIKQSGFLALKAQRRKATFVKKSFFLILSIPVNMPFHQLEGSTIETVPAVLWSLKEIILLAEAVRGLCALIQHYILFSINLGTLKTTQGFLLTQKVLIQNVTYLTLRHFP